jgi:phosphatidylserine decarboxylase
MLRAEAREHMVKEGYWFGLPPLVLGLLLLTVHSVYAVVGGCVLIFLGLFVFSFFRNPDRKIPGEPGLIVSPADGRVVVVKDEEFQGRPGKRISVFLAVWNVHVNRSPAAGTVTRVDYKPGKFLAAWAEEASFQNEQNIFLLATEHGEIMFKQIAGYIARRVVSWKKAGDYVARGERIGLVRFGSRMDLWLPANAEIAVRMGQNVKGGSSVLARLPVSAVKPVPTDAVKHSTPVGKL